MEVETGKQRSRIRSVSARLSAAQRGAAPGVSPVVKESPAPMTAAAQSRPYRLPFVIAASAAGTVIEWYDFYL